MGSSTVCLLPCQAPPPCTGTWQLGAEWLRLQITGNTNTCCAAVSLLLPQPQSGAVGSLRDLESFLTDGSMEPFASRVWEGRMGLQPAQAPCCIGGKNWAVSSADCRVSLLLPLAGQWEQGGGAKPGKHPPSCPDPASKSSLTLFPLPRPCIPSLL